MKKWLSMILVLLVVFTACPLALAEKTAPEPIEVSLLFPQNSALRPAMDKSEIWNYIYENTGVRFKLQILESSEQLSMIIAGGEYPDMMANVGLTGNQMTELVDAGALVNLNDYMDMMPSVKAFTENYQLAYNQCCINGGMYAMPWLNKRPGEMDIRCQWFCNEQWLKELGLEVPTTATELKNVLRAVKAAAGTGTIPINVEPLLFRWDHYIAGQFPIYCAFGVLVSDQGGTNYLTLSEDGKVIGQAINPDIKEPLKFMAELYAEGLILPEAFTGDWKEYLMKTSSAEPVQFMHFSVANRSTGYSTAMAPIDNELGRPVYVRVRANAGSPAYGTVVFDNGDEAKIKRIMEFLEWSMDFKNAFTINFGMEGVVWDYNEDGKMVLNFWEENVDKMNEFATSVGVCNSWFGVTTSEGYAENYYTPNVEIPGTTEYAIENIYKDYLIDPDQMLLFAPLDEDDEFRMKELETDLTEIRQRYMINWVMGKGDIDTEWDTYVEKMKDAGFDEWLSLKQKAYDKLMGRI